jgi:hypothetical protein
MKDKKEIKIYVEYKNLESFSQQLSGREEKADISSLLTNEKKAFT